MKSLWKDLLFLHGHINHQNLPWRTDTSPQPKGRRAIAADNKAKVIVQMRRLLVWPRIMQPR